MLLRGAIVLVSALAVAFGATRLHDERACNGARERGFAMALGQRAPGEAQAIARDVSAHCKGGTDLSAASAVLANAGALPAAQRLAREAVRRDPRDFRGWVALAIVAQHAHHPLAQRAAARRALVLNPRYGPAQVLASGARAGAGAGP